MLGRFSEGAMLAMDVALRTDRPLAELIQMSGTRLCEPRWTHLAPSRVGLRVVQSHGRQDPLLPLRRAVRRRDLLAASGLTVSWIEFDGGHDIRPPVLAGAGELIRAA